MKKKSTLSAPPLKPQNSDIVIALAVRVDELVEELKLVRCERDNSADAVVAFLLQHERDQQMIETLYKELQKASSR